ncbi:MAG: DUF4242 domain-containing protein [Dehalococcoidia bacterium]
MALFLLEFDAPSDGQEAHQALFDQIAAAAQQSNGELIEIQVGADSGVVYAIVEHRAAEVLQGVFANAGIEPKDVAEVRLVGPTLEDVKARKGGKANYLVEWDLPSELTMDQYLTNKKSKAHLYANVPETTFMRTYVREDMVKCLCLYDAPDEDAVLRAREAVSTPVDRVTRLVTD